MALEPAGLRWVNENLPSFIDGVRKANRAMGDAGDASQRTSGGFSALSGVIMGVASAGTTFALDAAVKMGSALVNLGASSIGVATEFQSMTARMEIAAGAAAEDAVAFGGLSEVALQVGGDTRLLGVSATAAADAMTGLMKSGLSLEAIMGDLGGYMEGTAELSGALRASIDLAAATTLDMVQASDVAAITLATFGGEMETEADKAQFITDAMNTLVKAADASVAEVEDLAEALAYVGPTAAQAGLSFEDTNTALAVLSTAGIQGSRAGTTLESMLRSLQDPSKKAKTALDGLGISMYDAEGVMLPLVDIIAQFEVALGTATDAERDAALGAIFTAQGQRSMNVFLGKGVEGWLGMAEAMKGATGIQEQAERRANTFAGRMEALQGNIETLKIRIGTALLPTLTDLMSGFSVLVDRYGPQLTQLFERVGQAASLLAGKLLGLLTGEITLENLVPPAVISGIDLATEGFKTLVGWIESLKIVVADLADWFEKGFTGEFTIFSPQSLETLEGLNTLQRTFLVLGIKVREAVGQIEEKFELLRLVWMGLTEVGFQEAGIIEFLTGLSEQEQAALGFGQTLRGIIESVTEFAGKIMEILPSFISWKDLLLAAGVVLAVVIGPAILGFLGSIVALAASVGLLVAKFAVLAAGIGILRDLWDRVGQQLAGFFAPTLERLRQGFVGFLAGLAPLQPIFQQFLANVQGALPFLAQLAGFIGGVLVVAFRGFLEIVARLLPAVSTIIVGIATVITGIFGGIITFLTGAFQMIRGLIIGDMDEARAGAERVLNGLVTAIQGILGGLVTIIMGIGEAIWAVLAGGFENLRMILVGESIIPDLVNSIVSWFAKLPELILAVLGGFAETIGELFKSVFGGLLEFDPSELASVFSQLLDGIQLLIETWQLLMATMKEAWTAFSNYLLHESWLLLREGWMLLTVEMEAMWQQALDAMEARFEAFLATVLAGIQQMIQAWNKLKAAIMAVAAAVVALHTSITKLTSDATIKRLDRVASAFDDIKNSAEAAAKACEKAASACSGVGGGGAGPTSMQAGGMFQVPSAVGPSGMLIRVHPRELVRVIPAAQVAAGVGMGGGEVSVTVGPNYISEEFDFAIFEDRVVRVVTDAIEA